MRLKKVTTSWQIKKKEPPSLGTPPLVWGAPSESYRWAKIAYTGEGRGGEKREKEAKEELMHNPHAHVELDTKKNEVLPDGDLQRFLVRRLDRERVLEEFDMVVTAEKFLRALAYIKFKNVTEIKVDRKKIYSHPERENDVRETISMLVDLRDGWEKAKSVRIEAVRDENHRAEIRIKRMHRKAEHAIDVQFEGDVEKRTFKQFINYLEKNLEILDVTE
jgi:hypothetical protein